jgi:hypothetical protein
MSHDMIRLEIARLRRVANLSANVLLLTYVRSLEMRIRRTCNTSITVVAKQATELDGLSQVSYIVPSLCIMLAGRGPDTCCLSLKCFRDVSCCSGPVE